MGRLLWLDGIRGLLASVVALSHIYGSITGYAATRPWRGASLAVDCFFVMSGFVLAYTIEKSDKGFCEYALRRVSRLWPLHALTLVLTAFVAVNNKINSGYVPPWVLNAELKDIALNFLAITNIWGRTEVFNDPSWSVSVELFVSIFILYGIVKFGMKKTALMLMVFSLGFLFYNDGFRLRSWSPLWIGVNGGLLRGISGVMLGYLVYKAEKVPIGLEFLVAPASLAIGYILLTSDGQYDVLGLVLFSLVVLTLKTSNCQLKRLLELRPFVYLGEVSYSLYLVHTAVILAMSPGRWSNVFGVSAVGLVFLVSLALASVVMFVFERPTRIALYKLIK